MNIVLGRAPRVKPQRPARVLPLRPGPGPADSADGPFTVDPADVHIAEGQRAHAELKAQQEIARQLERLAAAVEHLVAVLDQRRRIA